MSQKTWPYIGLFVTGAAAANLWSAYMVPRYGVWISLVSAFMLIGFDLTCRDALHEAWRGRGLVLRMGLLIASGSLIAWLVNRDAGRIAVVSLAAFGAAGIVDALTYHLLRNRPWLKKVNGSNGLSAATDSVVFPWLAFGAFNVPLMVGQFGAKVLGGFLWSLVLHRRSDAAARD